MHANGRLPNFLHVGPGKSGSTWLHEVLIQHPQVYLNEAKDLYFFSRYYERGGTWYASQFRDAPGSAAVVGEVCPEYLVVPDTPKRIAQTLGQGVSLMVTLREPVDRAFSSFLYLQRHGLAAPTFRETMLDTPELLEEGRYGTLLMRYREHFPASSMHVATFDELEGDPQAFLDDVTSWLGIESLPMDDAMKEARLPASASRFLPLAALARRGADWVRKHDGAELVGRVKRSRVVERVLYRPLTDDRPVPSPDDVDYVREQLGGELAFVEAEFGLPLTKMWGWQ